MASSTPLPSVGHRLAGQLTARETEVLRLIGEGYPNREIAEKLVVSEATVMTHVNSIFGKLGFESRAQGVAYAFRAGLIKS